jgi:hypothetical protein
MTPSENPAVSSNAVPKEINISLSALADLGTEHWRLATWLDQAAPDGSAALARHALRRMKEFLNSCELEIRSLDGQPYDAGMAARVVDTIDDPELPHGASVIAETVSPMVLWRGQVLRPADVVTRRGKR